MYYIISSTNLKLYVLLIIHSHPLCCTFHCASIRVKGTHSAVSGHLDGAYLDNEVIKVTTA